MVNHINENEFKNIEESKDVILVDFYATWCPPCQKLGVILEDVSSNTKYNISSINIDENISLATEYGIEVVPTLLIFKNGEVIDRKVGLLDKQEIIDILDKNIDN